MKLNTVICGKAEDVLKTFPDGCIDLTVTSPPYDNLRDYKGYTFNFKKIANELFRVTKQGGVVVWVVGDATINGSETGTSFKQALYFKEIGFNLHDTMIYLKNQLAFPSNTRYHQAFEYMFILSKHELKTFNPICDRKNKSSDRPPSKRTERNKKGELIRKKPVKVREYCERFNYWLIYNLKRGLENEHPATFPEKLARDHIYSWSNKGDTVLDPMCGSGTTLKMAKELGRNYVGIEISSEYCKIANNRLAQGVLQI